MWISEKIYTYTQQKKSNFLKVLQFLFKIELSNRKTFLVSSWIRTPNLTISIDADTLTNWATVRCIGKNIKQIKIKNG